METKIIKFYGIKFHNYEFKELFNKMQKGGVLVAPAASALIDIRKDVNYYNSLKNADFVILDSGLLCILLRLFRGLEAKKLSGYLFLKKFVKKLSNENYSLISIDPSKEESKLNSNFLKKKNINNAIHYIAPIYKKKNIKDGELLEIINKTKPKYILINIGGGIQERLGMYLKNNLEYKPLIICTGAAIAFLTKKQAPINDFIDRYYLGWLFRIINNPKIFLLRTLRSIKLIKFFFVKEFNENE